MSIDFNATSEQSSGSIRPIPPKSKVCVELSIVWPEESRQGLTDRAFTRSGKSSMEYLATVLTVTRGTFTGKKIYSNFNLAGAQTQGQQQAVDISMRRIRAMVESARGFSPKDTSPQATQARLLGAWSDLEGLQCFIEVDCQESQPSSKDGRTYINNVLDRVVTIDDPDYARLRQEGEIISSAPVPEPKATQANAGAPQPGWASGNRSASGTQSPAWGQPVSNGAGTASSVPPAAAVPAWGTPPPPPPPGNVDQVPF